MNRVRILLLRLWNVFRKQHLEQDLNSELQTHLDLVTDENIRRGMSPVEARHAARREFGGVEQTKDCTRAARLDVDRQRSRGCSLRLAHALQASWIHARRGCHSGPGHRRQYRHLHRRSFRAARTTAVSQSRSAGHRLVHLWERRARSGLRAGTD